MHPLGMALTWFGDSDEDESGYFRVQVCEEPDGFLYDLDVDEDWITYFRDNANAVKLFRKEKHAVRKKCLGYIIQQVPAVSADKKWEMPGLKQVVCRGCEKEYQVNPSLSQGECPHCGYEQYNGNKI